jgi:hypothetical protein
VHACFGSGCRAHANTPHPRPSGSRAEKATIVQRGNRNSAHSHSAITQHRCNITGRHPVPIRSRAHRWRRYVPVTTTHLSFASSVSALVSMHAWMDGLNRTHCVSVCSSSIVFVFDPYVQLAVWSTSRSLAIPHSCYRRGSHLTARLRSCTVRVESPSQASHP